MSQYASERDGDTYTCFCGKTKYFSRLMSTRDGMVLPCCKKKFVDINE